MKDSSSSDARCNLRSGPQADGSRTIRARKSASLPPMEAPLRGCVDLQSSFAIRADGKHGRSLPVSQGRLKFAESRSGTLNRFYTRLEVGELLAGLLHDLSPANVLDLGAGDGSLASTVNRKWPHAKIVTVDLDPDSIPRFDENDQPNSQHRHHIHDVLDANLPVALSQHGLFDLAVCNPPFYRPEWQVGFGTILDDAGLLSPGLHKADTTGQLLFLAQNLRLLRTGGTIAFIAPDGMLTGSRTKHLRRTLLQNHRMDCVLQLPGHSFHNTEARCFIFVMVKGETTSGKVKLLRLRPDQRAVEEILIDGNQAEHRLDFDYYMKGNSQTKSSTTLEALNAEIRRGSLSSSEAKGAKFSVFHTSNFSDAVDGSLVFPEYPQYVSEDRLVFAEEGDILLARVDRNLHQKIAIVVSGRAPITDCVYRIRISPEYRDAAFKALRSPDGEARMLSATKGVGARLIGKAELLSLNLTLQHI
jgi:type I restriction enzyme M protein